MAAILIWLQLIQSLWKFTTYYFRVFLIIPRSLLRLVFLMVGRLSPKKLPFLALGGAIPLAHEKVNKANAHFNS